ncbi:hypothetical protein CRYUN_Cryun13aG0091500 [Craigia yunnanensis]
MDDYRLLLANHSFSPFPYFSGGNGIRSSSILKLRELSKPLALGDGLVSKKFKAKSGKAYMFLHAMNVVLGPKYDKHLLTGLHTIADIYCSKCGKEQC